MKSFNFLVTIILVSAVSAVPLGNNEESNEINSGSDFVSGLNKCAYQPDSDGIINCAAERVLRSLDTLASQPKVEILPGVSLSSDSQISNFRSGKQLKEEIEEAKSNSGSMLELIGNKTLSFLADRTLKVKLPSSEAIGRALEEGRKRMGGGGKKNKGNMSMAMMGIGAAIAGLVPLFLGKVALITMTALLVGKIALVLSAILLIQMFRGSGKSNQHAVESSWNTAPQISYGPPANSYGPPSSSYGVPSVQYPYSRSFQVEDSDSKYSQELAYSSQRK